MSKKRRPWWVNAPRVSRDPALDIACPHCAMPPGTACVDGKGRPVHMARREASYRARYPAGPQAPEGEPETGQRT